MISGVNNIVFFDDKETKKIVEIRKKIHDKNYINYAVQRIATVLSKKLVEDHKKITGSKGMR